MRKSKYFVLLLSLFFCVIGFSLKSSAAENSVTLNYTAENQVRGANQVIIYTYENRTPNNKSGANEWGYEVSVDEDNIIVEMGVNVTFAPNGYIISAHGDDNLAFIKNNVSVGDKAIYDETNKTITFTFSILGSIANLEKEIKNLKNTKIELDYGAYDVDIKSLENDISSIEQKYDELLILCDEVKNMQDSVEKTEKEALIEQKYGEIIEIIGQANLKTIISLNVESRGVWHRPNVYEGEKTIEGITSTIDEIKSAGFNQIFLETLWWGHTIGTSEYMDYHPNVKDGDYGEYKDYLSAFIDIAHQKGIEVHAWTEPFFASHSKSDGTLNHYPKWLTKNPEWLNLTFNGDFVQTGKGTEENFIFIDPANEEVRNFLTNFYKELADNYDFDGIQFDYIRYPHEDNLEYSSGYTEVAMKAFKEEYNIDASSDLKILLTQEKSYGKDGLFTQWKEWRAAQVTKFVEETVGKIRETDKDIHFSIATGPDYEGAKTHLMQDWKTWVENGWIDIIAPMAYTFDVNWVETVVKRMNDISNGLTYNYTGIGAYMGGSPLLYTDEILASRKLKGLGSILFASQNILGQTEMKTVLSEGLYKHEAISPNTNIENLISTVFGNIIDKAERIYIPKELMTEEQKLALKTELDNIKKMPMNNADDYNKIIKEIKTLIFDVNNYVDSVGAQRVKEDLFSLTDLIDLKISRYLINNGYWDPKTESERPATDSFEYPVEKEEPGDKEEPDNKEVKEDNNYIPYIIAGGVLVCVAGASAVFVLRKKK
ncbi:family 10 glycosylhydrolase [Mycoplasmatota bacterium]|nr:family 10 glycosylhydrolase [Mycoplasmatota bacterium]